MTFLFTLFYVLSIVTITTQYKKIPETGNDTNVFGLIKLLQDISDRSATLTNDESGIDENDFATAMDDEPRVDADYENLMDVDDEDLENPKMKNILRWMPKRQRVKKSNIEKIEAERVEQNKLKVRAQNADRAQYVINSMKTNYWTTLYLWGEVTRILKERKLFDDMREMIQVVEKEGNEQLKESVLNCYRRLKKGLDNGLWDNKKTNNLIIDHVKHPDHEGILN